MRQQKAIVHRGLRTTDHDQSHIRHTVTKNSTRDASSGHKQWLYRRGTWTKAKTPPTSVIYDSFTIACIIYTYNALTLAWQAVVASGRVSGDPKLLTTYTHTRSTLERCTSMNDVVVSSWFDFISLLYFYCDCYNNGIVKNENFCLPLLPINNTIYFRCI